MSESIASKKEQKIAQTFDGRGDPRGADDTYSVDVREMWTDGVGQALWRDRE